MDLKIKEALNNKTVDNFQFNTVSAAVILIGFHASKILNLASAQVARSSISRARPFSAHNRRAT